MALTFSQFCRVFDEEKRLSIKTSIGICAICEKPITGEHPDEVRTVDDNKIAHKDCYFERLGEAVERHPICNPTRVRGA